ncbi:MAG: hypothetical protein KAI75_01850 [Desulfobulbaceae bacterium]|nr:hypothetical protein [Desulfobulbaceae bacterium]
MSAEELTNTTGSPAEEKTFTLQLQVREDVYRAFQRCTWIIIHETGRNQLDIMNEMVRDFLVKHGC